MKNNKAALGFIFITILIDVIGMGIIIPVTPKLIENLIQGDLSEASKYSGWLTFAYATMLFLFSPVLGGLSDKIGRRPVLLVSLFGLGADYLFMAFAPTIEWLFVGRVIAGICGASFTTATAYIADISEPEKRAQNFGLIGAAFGLGFILGPVIGGICSKWGVQMPFIMAASLSFLNFLYGFFMVPESLDKSHRRTFDWSRANPVGSLLQLRKHPVIVGLITSLILVYIASHAVQSNWAFYTMLKFDWTEQQVGYSLGVAGVCIAIVQGGLIRVINPWLGNNKSVYVGLFFSAFGLLLFGLATSGWMMYAVLLPYAMGGIAGPAIQGIISAQVPANEQGELQGALTSLMSITSIIGPPIMNNLFAYYTGPKAPFYFPGAPFMLACAMTLVSVWLAYRSLHKK